MSTTRRSSCTRTDPKKVEEVIRAGGAVMYPVDDQCSACRQAWDASHMMVIWDDEAADATG